MQHILVTGGAGVLGRLVVKHLSAAGYPVRGMSRRARALETIGRAHSGRRLIWRRARGSKPLWKELRSSCTVRAAARAMRTRPGTWSGQRRVPECDTWCTSRSSAPTASQSSSFIDRTMFGYFASKLAAEHVVAESGLPWTTLRATQFHYLTLKVARSMAKLPVVPLPAGFQFQPIDEGEVAARLAELALGAPAGLVPDMAGPKVYSMAELLRGYMQASHRHRPIIPVWLPGKAARAVRAGANLAPERAVGLRTWEEFLADQVRSSSDNRSQPALAADEG